MTVRPGATHETDANPGWRIEAMLTGLIHQEAAIRACAADLPLQSHPGWPCCSKRCLLPQLNTSKPYVIG